MVCPSRCLSPQKAHTLGYAYLLVGFPEASLVWRCLWLPPSDGLSLFKCICVLQADVEPSLVIAPDLAEAVDRSLLGAKLCGKAGQPSGCYTRTRVHCGERPATLHHGRHALVAQGPLVSKPPCKLVNSR